jgi:hypothetical protein
MAEVEFTREEAQSDWLPNLCMKCGEAATVVKDKHYTTDQVHAAPPPDAVGCLILGPILGLAKLISWSSAKTMTVKTPLCEKHAKGWFTAANFTAKTITDERITLTGVSDQFAAAWNQERGRTRSKGNEVIKIRCRSCQSLNDESAKFCNQCVAEI